MANFSYDLINIPFFNLINFFENTKVMATKALSFNEAKKKSTEIRWYLDAVQGNC